MKTFYGSSGAARLPAGLSLPALTVIGVPVESIGDITEARRCGRELSEDLGASEADTTFVATLISELARNIVLYAGSGRVEIEQIVREGKRGISITAVDDGPGISDLQRALIGGYSTAGRLGLGLCSVRRMADEFDIHSGPSTGTKVSALKWLR